MGYCIWSRANKYIAGNIFTGLDPKCLQGKAYRIYFGEVLLLDRLVSDGTALFGTVNNVIARGG